MMHFRSDNWGEQRRTRLMACRPSNPPGRAGRGRDCSPGFVDAAV